MVTGYLKKNEVDLVLRSSLIDTKEKYIDFALHLTVYSIQHEVTQMLKWGNICKTTTVLVVHIERDKYKYTHYIIAILFAKNYNNESCAGSLDYT